MFVIENVEPSVGIELYKIQTSKKLYLNSNICSELNIAWWYLEERYSGTQLKKKKKSQHNSKNMP